MHTCVHNICISCWLYTLFLRAFKRWLVDVSWHCMNLLESPCAPRRILEICSWEGRNPKVWKSRSELLYVTVSKTKMDMDMAWSGHFKPTISRCFPSAVVPSTAPLPTSFEASKAPAPLSAAARRWPVTRRCPLHPRCRRRAQAAPWVPSASFQSWRRPSWCRPRDGKYGKIPGWRPKIPRFLQDLFSDDGFFTGRG